MREVIPGLRIGNALEARDLSGVLNAGIEAVVDLAIEEPPISATREIICCRIPIVDGAGNSHARMSLAVRTILHLIRSGTPALVACSAGISRSPIFVAAALSRANSNTIQESLNQVAAAGPCHVSPALFADVVQCVDELSA